MFILAGILALIALPGLSIARINWSRSTRIADSTSLFEIAAKTAKVLVDAEIITVLSREAKKRREAVEAYTQAKRVDLANKEKAEAVVIALYLPEQLSEADIKKLIADAIAETNASGPAGMGLVMKVLQPKIAGKADGGLVSALVKAALAQ